MLRDIIADVLETQPDMEVLEEIPGMTRLVEETRRLRPAVVLTGTDDPGVAAQLLELMPRLKIFSVTEDVLQAWLYELQPRRVHLGEISPRGLVEEIRRRTTAPPRWAGSPTWADSRGGATD